MCSGSLEYAPKQLGRHCESHLSTEPVQWTRISARLLGIGRKERSGMFHPIKYVSIIILIHGSLCILPAAADRKSLVPHGIYSISNIGEAIVFVPNSKPPTKFRPCQADATKLLRQYHGLDITYRGSVKVGGLVWRLETCSSVSCSKEVIAYHPDPPRGMKVAVWFNQTRERAEGLLALWRTAERGNIVCMDAVSFWGNFRRF